MEKKNFMMFFRKKPTLALITLLTDEKAKYGSILAKKVDCTYSHAVKILNGMEKMKLIEFEKKGRTKLVKLTPKGKQVAELLKKLKEVLE